MRFVASPIGMAQLLHAPGSPVDRFVGQLAAEVEMRSKEQCHWDADHDFSRYPQHLRDTIHTEVISHGPGRGRRVGSSQDYALAHHDGSPGRTISPAPGKRLAFRNRFGKLIVLPVGRSVQVGPIPPNPYLREPLESVISRL